MTQQEKAALAAWKKSFLERRLAAKVGADELMDEVFDYSKAKGAYHEHLTAVLYVMFATTEDSSERIKNEAIVPCSADRGNSIFGAATPEEAESVWGAALRAIELRRN